MKKSERKTSCRLRQRKEEVAVQKKHICERKDKDIIKMKKRSQRNKDIQKHISL